MLRQTDIEYFRDSQGRKGYGWNFYPGCRNYEQGKCPLKRCWARGMERFRDPTFTPHLLPEKLLDPLKGYNPDKPRRIGVCFTGDLFGDWVKPDSKIILPIFAARYTPESIKYTHSLKEWVYQTMNKCPADTFVFLTKNPAGLEKWSPFPDNAWIGVSVCNDKMLDKAVDKLEDIQARHKWISFEPLLERITLSPAYAFYYSGVSWVVIGRQTPATSARTAPRIEWICDIVEAADSAGVPVWLKDNLRDFLLPREKGVPHGLSINCLWADDKCHLRQELPKDGAK